MKVDPSKVGVPSRSREAGKNLPEAPWHWSHRRSNCSDMETHGPLVGSLALYFTMLSPLLVLMIGLVSMWLVS